MKSKAIVLSDLNHLFTKFKDETDNTQFFMLVADYGKYILEEERIIPLVTILSTEARSQFKEYKELRQTFIDTLTPLTTDLFQKIDSYGFDDERTRSQRRRLKDKLEIKELILCENDLLDFYLPYKQLLKLIGAKIKSKDSLAQHYSKKTGDLLLAPLYSQVGKAGSAYNTTRKSKTWWSFYHVFRLADEGLKLNKNSKYFNEINTNKKFYEYYFNWIKENKKTSPIIPTKKEYENFISDLHAYLVPRIEDDYIEDYTQDNTLEYKSYNSTAYYKGNKKTFVGKGKALLEYLSKNKGTIYSDEEILKYCNPLLDKKKHFRKHKDILDTLSAIKEHLKVKKGEPFPIDFIDNQLTWLHKK